MRYCKLIATIALAATLSVATGATAAPRSGGARDLTVETGQAPAAKSRPLRISIMPVGPSTIRIGEPLRFRLVSLARAKGHLYVLSASGRTQLWMENVTLEAGKPVTYPRRGLTVRAAPPGGDDIVIFVASRLPIAGFAGTGPVTTPLELQLNHAAFRVELERRLSGLPRESWAFAELKIRVAD